MARWLPGAPNRRQTAFLESLFAVVPEQVEGTCKICDSRCSFWKTDSLISLCPIFIAVIHTSNKRKKVSPEGGGESEGTGGKGVIQGFG